MGLGALRCFNHPNSPAGLAPVVAGLIISLAICDPNRISNIDLQHLRLGIHTGFHNACTMILPNSTSPSTRARRTTPLTAITAIRQVKPLEKVCLRSSLSLRFRGFRDARFLLVASDHGFVLLNALGISINHFSIISLLSSKSIEFRI